jgi:Fatty acid desaturase
VPQPRIHHLHEHWLGEVIAAPLSIAMLLAVPWQIALVVVTLLWLGVWLGVKRLFGAASRALPVLARAPARLYARAAEATMASPASAPYLATLVGLGLYVPTLLGLSFWWQIHVVGVGRGARVDWAAVFLYHALWLGPNHLFFAHVATLVHHLGHQKRAFKPWFSPIGSVLVGILEVLYGHVPGQYPTGHVGVHHKFENGPEDLTSTMALDRGSFSGWLRYRRQFLLFWSGAAVVHFFARRGRRDYAWIQLRGMLVFYGIVIAVCLYNLELGFAYFVLPTIVIVNFISAINFTWHMFIDPRDPENVFTNSITILNAQQDVWNEAHHISHHARPQVPWTRMPDHFNENTADYAAMKANVFKDTQVFEIFVLSITGQIDKLADRFVDLSGTLSRPEIVALLRERLRPVEIPAEPTPVATDRRGPRAGLSDSSAASA